MESWLIMKKQSKIWGLPVLLASSLILAACGSSEEAAESTVDSNPYGTNAVDPAPPGTTILTVTNGSTSTDYTIEELQEFGTEDISIFEPFIKKRQGFTVIPLSEIFSRNNISESAEVVTAALNDYIYSDTAKNFTTNEGYLAIAREGENIPYDQGGPIRIIFADDSGWATHLDAWTWSIRDLKTK
jgi:hypothetical protein